MDDLSHLGRKLRDLRQRRELSLSEVARATNISASMLSQLERGIVAPSLATVNTLAQFYETRLFELFQDPGQQFNGVLVRRGERAKVRLSGSNAAYELISGTRQDLQLVEIKLEAGQGVVDHTMSHPGEECALVLEGSVRAHLGGQEFDLEEGDSLQYRATVPHSYAARTEAGARLIIAMTPPSF
jgi:transcriptional regulator with XRE-family HTH domain